MYACAQLFTALGALTIIVARHPQHGRHLVLNMISGLAYDEHVIRRELGGIAAMMYLRTHVTDGVGGDLRVGVDIDLRPKLQVQNPTRTRRW